MTPYLVLDELMVRGYDAVRIDVYPHYCPYYPGWLSSVGTVHAAVILTGSGSELDPYQITSAEELNEIRNKIILEPNANFILNDHIDLSTHLDTINWAPIPNFAGSLNGNGKKITQLKIDTPYRRPLKIVCF